MQLSIYSDLLLFFLLVLLFLAVSNDFIKHRIPNKITFSAILSGILFQAFTFGIPGLLSAAGGLVTGLILFLPFYLKGGMGAGDVKLMAALGTFLAPFNTFIAAALALLAGGVLAGLFIIYSFFSAKIRSGQLKGCASESFNSIRMVIYTRQFTPSKQLAGNDQPTNRFPYALAIATGSIIVLSRESLLEFHHLRSLLEGGLL